MAFPAEKLDLELAFRRVKFDVHRGFITAPLEFELVQVNEAEYLQHLQQKVREGYHPSAAYNHPEETQPFLDYFSAIKTYEKIFPSLINFLLSADNIYNYQTFQIVRWVTTIGLRPPEEFIAIARRLSFDNSRPHFLRAICRVILQEYGTTADLDRLEASYSEIHQDFERAQTLGNIKRMEVGRRNAFYGRVVGDGLLCSRAITLVKSERV